MPRHRIAVLLGLLVATAVHAQAPVPAPAPAAEPSEAEKLFQGGKFTEARAAFTQMQKADAKNHPAAMRLGHIALLENNFAEAEKWLRVAESLQPDHKPTKALLAELYYRQDDFARAAPFYRAADREVIAAKLESFSRKTPYQIAQKEFDIHVKWVQSEPLPLLEARANGGEPALFLIDTGGPEIILGKEYARQLHVPEFGDTAGQLAAGRAAIGHGRLDSFTLGGLEVRNVPVNLVDESRFAAGAPGKKVAGIIGSVFLYHFLSTLDYPKGELVLRPRSAKSAEPFEKSAQKKESVVVPFWMAGDHYMLAWGRINKSGPMLWFVDTGLAGRGFIGPVSTFKDAGIDTAAPGQNPSGAVVASSAELVVDEIALGDAVQQKIIALQGALSSIGGVKIGGLISHQFFKPYALTLDFQKMRLYLSKGQ